MPSTFSPNRAYELMATGENDGTWGIKTDANLSIIDLNFGGRLNISVAGSSNVTVNATQAQNVTHVLTGLLTGNIQYILPAVGSFYILQNSSTGAFSITVTMAGGGATRVLQRGEIISVFVNPDATTGVLVVSTSFSVGGFGGTLYGGGAGGSANAQTLTLSPAPTAYTTGMLISWTALGNTGATTLNLNSLGAKTLLFRSNALTGGELVTNGTYVAVYDGIRFQLINANTTSGALLNVQTISVSGAYTATANTRFVIVEVVAGGGGGGASDVTGASTGAAGGGGGGGGYARRLLTIASAAGATVTVGASGAAGVGAGADGGTGGTTSFGALLSATGGAGGQGGQAIAAGSSGVPGGAGGIGSSGDVNLAGGFGGGAPVLNVANVYSGGGGACASYGNGGGTPANAAGSAVAGANGRSIGGGASGGASPASKGAANGGTGGGGRVFVWEYS